MNPKSILVVALVLLGLGASVMIAEAQGPQPGGRRAPTTSGTFTVNSNADTNTANSSLTLREALYLARDGTDGVNGLGRGLTDGEKGQTSGCLWTGSSGDWHINGGCGTAITDTIVFSLGSPTTITLGTTSLPLIDDSAPTIVDGTSVTPTIDASGVSGFHNGLHVSSNQNVISRIAIRNASLSNFYIDGDNNTLSNVRAWNAFTNGIYVLGSGNQITQTLIGVESATINCGANKGNGAAGIFVDGAFLTTIVSSTIGCNGGDGVTIDNSAFLNTVRDSVINLNNGNGITLDNGTSGTIILTNDIGQTSCACGNAGNGLLIQGGAHDNTVGSSSSDFDGQNFIVYNGLHGVTISGTNTATNTLISNYTSYNSASGIRITQGAHNNSLENGGPSIPLSNNNGQNGILLAAGAYSNTIINNGVADNGRNGIELSGVGTSGNVISFNTRAIANTRDGINERNNADNNVWTQISVYDNGGLGIDKNAPSDGTNEITPPFPVITSVSCGGGNCTVSGTASPPGTGSTVVEVYVASLDPSGYGEGKTYLNSTSATAGGNWATSVSSSNGTCFTAFQTKTTAGGVSTSSEFGPNSCRLFLPLILK